MPAEELYRAQIQIPHLYSSNLFFYRSINYVVLSSYPRPSLILFFFALLSHVAFLFLATALSIQPAREPCSLGRRLIRIGQRTCSHMPYETRNSFRDSFNKRRYRETRCNHVIYLPFSLDCKTQQHTSPSIFSGSKDLLENIIHCSIASTLNNDNIFFPL